MVDVFHKELAYLKVDPQLAQGVVLTDQYIKSVNNGKKERNIFNNVSYDEEEKVKIKEIESMAQSNNVHHELFSSTGQILKFIYANQLDTKKAFDNMIEHIKWIENPKTFSLSEQTRSHLSDGQIYIGGTDKQMRPTIIFNVVKIDLNKTTEESILPAYSRIFKIIEEYFFYKSKIESWNVIIETSEISVLSFPIQILGKIITTMQNNFPSNMNKLFILNPSRSLNFTWNLIAAFISENSLKKISFLKKSEMKQMLDFYDADQLEQKFGGTCPNISVFYPPVKFQPNQFYANKAQQGRTSQRQFQPIIDIENNKYNVLNNNVMKDSFEDAEYQYKNIQQANMYNSATPVQHNYSIQQENLELYRSPSSMSSNKYDIPLQQQSQQQQYFQKQYVQENIQSNPIPQIQQYEQQQQFSRSSVQTPNYVQSDRNTNRIGLTATPPSLRFSKSQKDDISKIAIPPPNFRQSLYQEQPQSSYSTQQPQLQQQLQSQQKQPHQQIFQQYQQNKQQGPQLYQQERQQQDNYNYQADQQQGSLKQQSVVSKYSIVNEILNDQYQNNLLNDLYDNDDKVKKSRNTKQSVQVNSSTNNMTDIYSLQSKINQFQGNDPQNSLKYMENLRDQNYKACNIF